MDEELSIMKRRSTLSAGTMGGGWPPELEPLDDPELEPPAVPESGPAPALFPPQAAMDEASERSAAIPRR
jgi:hypothetical protein